MLPKSDKNSFACKNLFCVLKKLHWLRSRRTDSDTRTNIHRRVVEVWSRMELVIDGFIETITDILLGNIRYVRNGEPMRPTVTAVLTRIASR